MEKFIYRKKENIENQTGKKRDNQNKESQKKRDVREIVRERQKERYKSRKRERERQRKRKIERLCVIQKRIRYIQPYEISPGAYMLFFWLVGGNNSRSPPPPCTPLTLTLTEQKLFVHIYLHVLHLQIFPELNITELMAFPAPNEFFSLSNLNYTKKGIIRYQKHKTLMCKKPGHQIRWFLI